MNEHPMDDLEMLNTARSLARLCHQMFESLVAEGFNETQALGLTLTYLNSLITGATGAQATE